jgi:hypothetical protein
MTGYVRIIVGVVAGVLVSTFALAQVQNVASPIRSFDWTYGGNPEPGNRHWSSPDGVIWTETSPSGYAETQKVGSSAQVNGCDGVITKKSASPIAQTFIPNPGCPSMVLLLRLGDGAWRPLGEMRSINTGVAAATLPSAPSVTAGGGQMLAQLVQTPATFPATPDRLALARRLVGSLDGPVKLHAFGELGVLVAKKQLAEELKDKPAAQRAVVEKAYLDALPDAQAHYETRAIDNMVEFYASHLSSDDMMAAIAFYASPLGVRIVHPDPPPTAEERQQIGKAMLDTPALQRVAAVQLAMIKTQQALLPQEQARLMAETKAGFCRRLAVAHFKSAACQASVQAVTSR